MDNKLPKDVEIVELDSKKELPPLPKIQPEPISPKNLYEPQFDRPTPKPLAPYQQNNSNPMPRDIRRQEQNKFNQNPIVQANGLKLVSKKWFYLSLVFAIIFALLFTGNIVWTNTNISLGKLGTYINNTINVEPAQVEVPVNVDIPTTNNNNFTIKIENKIEMENNTKLSLDNKTITEIVNRISEEILSEINSS